MDAGELMLVASAATLGAAHTLLGLDHTVPVIALSRARGWNQRTTLLATLGLGGLHLASAWAIFEVGRAVGAPLQALVDWETLRGAWALRVLFLVGFGYGTLALFRALGQPFIRDALANPGRVTGVGSWLVPVGLTASVLGPCEPLIPVLGTQAALSNPQLGLWVSLSFGAATLLTMTSVVLLATRGLSALTGRRAVFQHFERFSGALAGYSLCVVALLA